MVEATQAGLWMPPCTQYPSPLHPHVKRGPAPAAAPAPHSKPQQQCTWGGHSCRGGSDPVHFSSTGGSREPVHRLDGCRSQGPPISRDPDGDWGKTSFQQTASSGHTCFHTWAETPLSTKPKRPRDGMGRVLFCWDLDTACHLPLAPTPRQGPHCSHWERQWQTDAGQRERVQHRAKVSRGEECSTVREGPAGLWTRQRSTRPFSKLGCKSHIHLLSRGRGVSSLFPAATWSCHSYQHHHQAQHRDAALRQSQTRGVGGRAARPL